MIADHRGLSKYFSDRRRSALRIISSINKKIDDKIEFENEISGNQRADKSIRGYIHIGRANQTDLTAIKKTVEKLADKIG